ncbi:MAG: MltA domain-containing protein [Phycisphaerales bacterium]|nr:MltA domain-containing protein [Phycisphaerales bacterium]MCI0630470.1 MltA domain-containing protein [Phycisphaerales bacterium]MCI0676475.1 MltA domain-containing protein [Phycisphaerales bacterium]
MKRIVGIVALSIAPILAGCSNKTTGPDYTHKLGPGQSALRLITDPNRLPDLGGAYRNRDMLLLDGIDQSLSWFAAPSSKRHFPFESITHEQAQTSLMAFGQLLESSSDEAAFVSDVKRLFDVYESVGYNDEGIVLFTGYYAPIFPASKTKSSRFAYPLYKRPADLATDPTTGQPLGRKLPSGQTVPYYTRAEIEQSKMLGGTELIWLEDPLSVYIIHVNGSAKVRLDNGSEMYVGYAGKTDRPYVGLGKSMIDEGLIDEDELSLPAIRSMYRTNPQKVMELINRNESYVFFKEYAGDKWPAGSLGVRVCAETSLATDKRIYPRGGMVLVDTQAVQLSTGKRRFLRYMLDQDTGGAIQAPGRADIFMGVGNTAEILAGGQYAEGRLYYLFLKPEFVQEYMPTARVAGK